MVAYVGSVLFRADGRHSRRNVQRVCEFCKESYQENPPKRRWGIRCRGSVGFDYSAGGEVTVRSDPTRLKTNCYDMAL